jgi:hypothetical protein
MFVLFVWFVLMKAKTRNAKAKRAKAESQLVPVQKIEPQISPIVTLDNPPPDYLRELAMGEPDRRLLQEYIETIRILRTEKGFTFREIAAWLSENGIKTDHNAVYRAYTKDMPEADQAEIERLADEEEASENRG